MFTHSMVPFTAILLGVTVIHAEWIQPLNITWNRNSTCVPVGSDLNITCTRNPEYQSAGLEQNITVYKKFGGSYTTLEPTNIQQGVEVLLTRVTLNDSAISCCLGNNCVGLKIISGEPPPAPPDFECVIYNTDYLECTWTSKERCVTWSIQYETVPNYGFRNNNNNLTQTACNDTRTLLSHECPNTCSDYKECIRNVWRLETPMLDVVYTFNLTGSGIYGASTYYYNISTSYAIEKLGKLSNCNSKFNGSTVIINCKFPLPPAAFWTTGGLRCNITAKSAYRIRYDTVENQNGDFHYRLLDTHPYTFYSVSLTCQVNKSLYWGNPVTFQFTTTQDVPLVGPSTSNQSYAVWCKAGKQYISIYIQPPNAYQTQGILTGYNMRIQSSAGFRNQSFIGNKTTLVFSSISSHICGSSANYDVTIWSQTSEGDSKKGTHLSISANPTIADMVITEVIVEETNSGYLVSWTGQSNLSYNCVYHWCISDLHSQERTDNVTCLRRYNFTESTSRQLLITPDTDDGWKFGVSQNGTGIRWQDCVFSNGPPITKPDRLDSGSSIKLPENMEFCSKRSQKGPKPLEYLIQLTDVDSRTSENITVNASMSTNFNRIQLSADTLYTVKYMIIYYNGQSEFSDAMSINTTTRAAVQQTVLESSSSTTKVWKIAGGIMGSIAFLIIALILVYTANWRWKHIDDKIEDVSVQQSDNTESRYTESFGTVTSTTPDSGRGTLSSTYTSFSGNQLQRATIPVTPLKPQNRLPLSYDIDDVSQTNDGFLVSKDEESDKSEQVPIVTNVTVDTNEYIAHPNNIQFFNDNVKFSINQNTDYIQIDQVL